MPRTYTHLHYHIVFSTKDRLPMITPPVRDELYHFVGGISAENSGVLNSIGGIADHVHLLVGLKPTIALATFVQRVKGSSSRWLNESKKTTSPFSWQEGYGAFTVSASQMGIVRKYIQTQEQHHRKMSYNGEMKQLLRKHGIEFFEDDFVD